MSANASTRTTFVCSVAPMLSVRRGTQAVEFYKSAFGAVEVYHVEDPGGSVVSRLSVDGAEFWLSDESPEHGNFSPESRGGSNARPVLTGPSLGRVGPGDNLFIVGAIIQITAGGAGGANPNVPANQQAAVNGAQSCASVIGFIIYLIFLLAGIQTVQGKAKGLKGNGIGSIVFSLLFFVAGVAGIVNAMALRQQQPNTEAAREPFV